MARSFRVKQDYIAKVKLAVQYKGYPRQQDLADDLGMSLATVSNFLNGKSVYNLNFQEIAEKLGFDWAEICETPNETSPKLRKPEVYLEREPYNFQYIEREPYESQCYEFLAKPGALIRIKAPEEMGKTTLLTRVLSRVNQQDYKTRTLSFELADCTILNDLRQFSRWFCASVAKKLELPNNLDDYWDDIFGCNSNTTAYFQDYLLPKIDSSLVLALDNVDRVFEHQAIADDFCRLLRGWYDSARRSDRNSAIWNKLRLIIAHSTEVYSALDVNHSPLSNVGFVIELAELTPEQVQNLAELHELNWQASQVNQLMAMVGGHPYLVKLTLDYICRQNMTLDYLLQIAPTEAGIFRDHLRKHLGTLKQHPELAAAFYEVAIATEPVQISSEQVFKLHSLGLVKLQGNQVTPRCNLYRQYFPERLGVEGQMVYNSSF